jgi:hypothetical protein
MPRLFTIALASLTAVLTCCGGKLAFDAELDPIDEPSGEGHGSALDDAGSSSQRPDAGRDASADGGEGDASSSEGGSCARFITSVVEHAFGPGQDHNQVGGFPDALYGPPVAGSPSSVVSLGNGGHVVVAFGESVIVDGPGVDFTVFENPLASFRELATVAVSDDGIVWYEYPCTAARNASDYGYCAGVNRVWSTPTNGVDPLDPAVSGGDSYDLADVGLQRARFVRITDRPDLIGDDGVFDLDAVAIVNVECGGR